MEKQHFSKAYIKRYDKSIPLNLLIDLPKKNTSVGFPFLLIIQSNIKKFMRLTIYPVKKERIIKIFSMGVNVKSEELEKFIEELQKFEIIHTSGLILKGNEIIYECYLNLNSNDERYKDLKIALDKFKNISKVTDIEEISTK
ncbi:MAG: hypothetical protein ACFFD5_04370 [Candidatus Thorarchaeota archaeon]